MNRKFADMLSEKVDMSIARKLATDDRIQTAIHDAIENHFGGKAHDQLNYYEYYELYAAIAREVAKNQAPTGKLKRTIDKMLGK